MSDLKPCPWCGEVPDDPWRSKIFGGLTIECKCEMVVLPVGETKSDTIAAWNRRARTPLEQAAIAYVHRDTQPLSPESAAAWERLKQAVGDFEGEVE